MPEPTETVSKIFRWTDEDGNVSFASELGKVPSKYRDDVKAFGAEDAEVEAASAVFEGVGGEIGEQIKKHSVAKAKKISKKLGKNLGEKALAEGKKIQDDVGVHVPFVKDLDLPSAGFGFAAALAAVVMFKAFTSSAKLVVKLLIVGFMISLLTGGYFGAIRKNAGLSEQGGLTSPKQLIDDAKNAVKSANEHYQKQQRDLEKIEEGTK